MEGQASKSLHIVAIFIAICKLPRGCGMNKLMNGSMNYT